MLEVLVSHRLLKPPKLSLYNLEATPLIVNWFIVGSLNSFLYHMDYKQPIDTIPKLSQPLNRVSGL